MINPTLKPQESLSPEISITAVIGIQSDVVKKDGTSPIYLFLKEKKNRKKISLKMFWPSSSFDKLSQSLLPRHKKDADVVDLNIVLNMVKSKCNDIIRSHRLCQRELSIEQFANEFHNYAHKDCFVFYSREKAKYLYEKGINSKRSMQRHNTSINVMDEFIERKVFPMSNLDIDFVRRFDNFLRRKKYMHNTITSMHKVIKTYINHALEDGYLIQNPYKNFKVRYVPGDRPALTAEEVGTLKSLLKESILSEIEKEALKQFLFSCYTGLRVSDSSIISSGQISDGVLTHKLKKGERFGKEIRIKIPVFALELIKGRRGVLFPNMTDVKLNIHLKTIFAHARILKKATTHVARDTFATLFISFGGDIASLKDLMGHSMIQTTQIYLKMNNERKDMLMDRMDNL